MAGGIEVDFAAATQKYTDASEKMKEKINGGPGADSVFSHTPEVADLYTAIAESEQWATIFSNTVKGSKNMLQALGGIV